MFKKIVISAVFIFAFIGYILFERGVFSQKNNVPVAISDSTAGTSASGANNATDATSGRTVQNLSPGKYKDGIYTGDSVDAFYGQVQVRVTINSGAISNVSFLSYPKDARHSFELSQSAMPILKSEAIQAQSSNVDIVSGATQTSEAFKQSLQSALNQAI